MLKLLKLSFSFIFLLVSVTIAYGQTLQRESISIMGFSETLASGYYVSSSIGQQRAIGQFILDNNVYINQGFQHPIVFTICYEDCNPKNIKTMLYPNPFIDTVNLKFSEKINEEITISIYDILGRILYKKKEVPFNDELIINEINVKKGNYIIELKSVNYRYTAKILKK
jgi:hypothetical protein